jgi:cytochrome c oxidase subunit 4
MKVEAKEAATWPFVVAWAVLLLLAGVSMLTAYLGLGVWAPVVQFGIAAIQVAIIAILFMRLKGPPSLKWIFAGTGIFWLMFMFGLTMTDYTTRNGWPSIQPGLVKGSYSSSTKQ